MSDCPAPDCMATVSTLTRHSHTQLPPQQGFQKVTAEKVLSHRSPPSDLCFLKTWVCWDPAQPPSLLSACVFFALNGERLPLGLSLLLEISLPSPFTCRRDKRRRFACAFICIFVKVFYSQRKGIALVLSLELEAPILWPPDVRS